MKPTLGAVFFLFVFTAILSAQNTQKVGPHVSAPTLRVGKLDSPQLGGTSLRNNAPAGMNIPATWDVQTGKNIKWKVELGTNTYGTPVVANGKVFIGTNNGRGYVKRFPPAVDLGCLLCFDEQTGKFLWQHSVRKLKSGRVNDWPEQGICATPLVDGDRLWVVTNRCEVVCLDTNGFHDGENDGPYTDEDNTNKDEADIVWKLDMIAKLKVFPHNMSTCSVTTDGERLFVCTSNGVDATHINIPCPDSPSFVCLDRKTGKVLWTDNSPGKNILHGQWASPSYFVIGDQPQVLFPGGDGWLYSFDPHGDGKGKSKLLWKFDCNPKTAVWKRTGNGTRSFCCSAPCVYKNRVYITVGDDLDALPEHGHLWCIDPVKKLDGSDVSPTLAVDRTGKRLPHRRERAVILKNGEREIKNPNSALVWHYNGEDRNRNGKFDVDENMHGCITTPAIKNDILVIADLDGIVHCINATTGRAYWTFDTFAQCWSTPLIVDGKVYIADTDGDVAVFPLTPDPKKALVTKRGEREPSLGTVRMFNSVHNTPVVANNVLFITGKNTLYAISSAKRKQAPR